jgi:hypothetical protein
MRPGLLLTMAALFFAHSAHASWEHVTLKDDFDDSVTHLIEVKSSETVNGKVPALALICGETAPYWAVTWGDGNLLDQTFSSNQFVPGGVTSDINIRVIIDGEEQSSGAASVWNMIVEKDHSTMTTYRVPAILRKLREASVLKMRVQGYPSAVYDAVFDVAGLDAALEELRPECRRLPK